VVVVDGGGDGSTFSPDEDALATKHNKQQLPLYKSNLTVE